MFQTTNQINAPSKMFTNEWLREQSENFQERERESKKGKKNKATMLPQALLNNSKAQFEGHQKIRDGIPQAQISERCCRMCKLSCNMMIMMCSELLTNISTSTCPHSVDLLRVPPNSFLFGVSTADGSLAMTQAA